MDAGCFSPKACPYLPSFSDGYVAERLTETLANAIVERPGMESVFMDLATRELTYSICVNGFESCAVFLLLK